jgi:hypothetical protein
LFKSQSSPRRISAVLATAALVLSGLAGVSGPAYASETKKLNISGFAPNSVALTTSMKQRIDRFIKANDEYSFVSCVGFADRAGSATTNNALGKGRAKAGCDQAVSASSEVEVVSSRGRWDRIRSGASIRRVEITLSKSSTSATSGFTTYFEYMGGEKGIAEVKTLADGTLVLPTPTRRGFEFLGWFSDQYNGTKIGNGGDTYKPKRTRILWAQWFVPSSGSSSGAPSSPSLSIAFTWGLDFTSLAATADVRRDEELPDSLSNFCNETVSVVVEMQVGTAEPVQVGDPTEISPCTGTPYVAENPEDIVLGTGNFNGILQGVTPGSGVQVTIILTLTSNAFVYTDVLPGGGWSYGDSIEVYEQLIPVDAANNLVFDFRGYAA